MIENRGKTQGFSTRGSAENKTTAKKTIWKDDIFLKTGVGAREAREEDCYMFLTSRSYSCAPQAPFFFFVI